MIKLSNFLEQGNIFAEIWAIQAFPFLNGNNVNTVNNLLKLGYGEKTVFSKLEIIPLNEIAEMLVLKYGDGWNDLVKVQAVTFEVGATSTRKVVETINENETRNNTRDDVNKVSAFNSDDMINNDGVNSISNDALNNDKTRTLTDSNIDINTAFNNLSLSSKNRIIDLILKDTSQFLSLSIY